jgi:tRNA U34 5-methylaminomethyl-2-thiouridine-forming methyltransferase MnmC
MPVEKLESVALDLVTKLACGKYEEVVAACAVTRLSADDLREVIADYGKTFIVPPTDRYEGFDALFLPSFETPTWSVRAPLWSKEEGRSDLELQLTIHREGESFAIELDNLHVP